MEEERYASILIFIKEQDEGHGVATLKIAKAICGPHATKAHINPDLYNMSRLGMLCMAKVRQGPNKSRGCFWRVNYVE